MSRPQALNLTLTFTFILTLTGRLQAAISSLPPSAGRPLRSLFTEASDAALDLLDGMLRFNPDRRLTAAQALAHPFLASLHDPDSEPLHSEPFVTPDIDDEDLDWPTVRKMVTDEAKLWSVRHGRRPAAQGGSVLGGMQDSAAPLQSSAAVALSSASAVLMTDAAAAQPTGVAAAAGLEAPSGVASELCKRGSSSGSVEDEGGKRAKAMGLDSQ